MKKTHARRALLMSALSLLLCVSMLVGTTFAWFTDSVVSANNVIKSGNLDIEVQYTLDGENWKDLNGAKDLFQKDLWEPGHTEVVALKIENKGSLALKYTASMNIVDEIVGKTKENKDIVLSEILTVGTLVQEANQFGEAAVALAFQNENMYKGTTTFKASNILKENQELQPGAAHYVVVKVDMAETVGNEANHDGVNAPSITFGINVLATQFTYEKDSFGKDYDEDAKYDREIWDGMTTTTPVADAEGVYHITTAAELVGMMNDSKYPNNNKYQNVVLENNIDLMGNTIPGFGDDAGFFDGTFDGQGYTISNFKIDATDRTYYAGLFNQVSQYSGTDTVIKNLTVSNATIRGTSQVGAIVGGMNGNTIVENCKVIDCELYAVKKVGSVVGYTAGGTVKDCYAEDCTVVYSEKEGSEILGYENTGSTVSGNTFKNVVVAASVATADELLAAVNAGAAEIRLAPSANFRMPSSPTNKTVKIIGNSSAVIDMTWGAYWENAKVTFENVTFKTTFGYVNGNGSDYAAFYSHDVVYNDCTFNGGMLIGRDGAQFNGCTFNVTSDYVRAYGNDVTFEGCTFNTVGKAILVYSDGGNEVAEMSVKNCKFYATTGAKAGAIANQNCAAIEIHNYGNGVNLVTAGNTHDANFSGEWRIKTYEAGRPKVIVNGVEYTTLALDGKTMTIDANKNVTVN